MPDSNKSTKSETTQLIEAFSLKYETATGQMFLMNSGKARSYSKRILSALSLEDAIDLIEWLFDNWSDVSFATKLTSNLSLNLLATYSYLERFRYFREHGVPTNPNTRGTNMDEYTMDGFYESL